jgi:hypothetical protein
MPAMRRGDRGNSNSDNERNNPRSRRQEPLSYHELKQQRDNARADRSLLQQEKVQLQQQFQTLQLAVDEWEQRATQNHQLYLGEQQKYQQTLCLYNEEKARSTELLVKYEEADAQRTQYLTLYNEAQELLKYERRSKAGIKSWETRRKIENERLKQEIAEMVVLLRESLASKDEAVNSLYSLAERMDRIQQLVDSVEEESTGTPVSLLQKLRRIWLAIKDILSE